MRPELIFCLFQKKWVALKCACSKRVEKKFANPSWNARYCFLQIFTDYFAYLCVRPFRRVSIRPLQQLALWEESINECCI